MATSAVKPKPETLRTLPGDDVRQILWRFADRYDLQMLVQSSRRVARGPVARLVAAGERNTHEWTAAQGRAACRPSTAPASPPSSWIPRRAASSPARRTLRWRWSPSNSPGWTAAPPPPASPDAWPRAHSRARHARAGRRTTCASPRRPQPGEDRKPWRGAFCLTEPIPYVGVDTGMLSGKVRIAEWKDGEEPMLQVDKRGRFITNIAFANFVTAAVDSDDPRIKGSCMVILEESDPGIFDRGTPTKKLVHQLSSTGDPIFNLKVPASRIVGGYTVKDGVIIPNYNHGEIIEAVFRRTRVTVGLMTAAKLLSAVEPVIRYQRGRFRGAEQATPGTVALRARPPAARRRAASPGRHLGHRRSQRLARLRRRARSSTNSIRSRSEKDRDSAAARHLRRPRRDEGPARQPKSARSKLCRTPAGSDDRRAELESDPLVRFVLLDSEANVLCPATKLWNTGHGANMMREAVSLMGGYGITEDCPGFLGHKWMDAQLEATYEGPEAVQRRQLSVTMTNEVFLAQFRTWIAEMRRIASDHPGTGACTLATAMQMWLWTLDHLQTATDADGAQALSRHAPGRDLPARRRALLAARLAPANSRRARTRNQRRGQSGARRRPAPAPCISSPTFATCKSARAAGEVGRICAELVFGYNRHPAWDEEGYRGCFQAEELDSLEGLIPGIAACATDVIAADGSHPAKAGPCAGCAGIAAQFLRAAQQARHLPHRLAPGQRPRRRSRDPAS